MRKVKFIFDLDSTVTSQETLPLIASHFGVEEKISELTRKTIESGDYEWTGTLVVPYVLELSEGEPRLHSL